MVKSPYWLPRDTDPTVPNVARMYDYWLDGAHNFAADRLLVDKVQQLMPEVRDAIRAHRAFLRRAVLFLVESGIRQFLDIGSGIPTVGNVHEIAQRANPECRVVYVDKEPIAVSHSELLLHGNDRAAVIQADVRAVDEIFGHPKTKRLLDFDEPIGLLLLGLLYFIPDSWNPVDIVARYRDGLPPGSFLAISHGTTDGNPAGLDETLQLYKNTPDPMYFRSYEEVLRFFDGFELVEPGLVSCASWRPSGPSDSCDNVEMNALAYGGVGCKL
jgi:hypothetical protein